MKTYIILKYPTIYFGFKPSGEQFLPMRYKTRELAQAEADKLCKEDIYHVYSVQLIELPNKEIEL